MEERQIIIASNRGPISFVRGEDGEVVPKRGGGGLVSALTDVLQLSGGLWMASAMSDEDKKQTAGGRLEVAAEDAKYNLRYLSFDQATYDLYYNDVSNKILWFLHHYLWDVVRAPSFDEKTRTAWDAYRQVNQAFARGLIEEGDGCSQAPNYLIQDYHLCLVPEMLRERRPDARIVHFAHIPFAGASYLRILPAGIRNELLTGLLGADVLGFQADQWAENFLLCCRSLPEARVDLRRRVVDWGGREVRVGVYPITIDAEAMRLEARSERSTKARQQIARWRGDSKLILRVDRTELSKNIVRGFAAYEDFLRRKPEWRRRVKFLALLVPSRRAIPEYRAYTRECLGAAERINDELGDTDWQPIEVSVKEDYPRALGAYGLYDVLMVNPVYDGMNLIAKEGPVLNRRHGVLILSQNAGAVAELGRYAISVNPFDVGEMSAALSEALSMSEEERVKRSRALSNAITRSRPENWVLSQLKDLEAVASRRGA